MNTMTEHELISTGEATAILPVSDGAVRPVTVIGTEAIRATFDQSCLRQAVNSRLAPGVEHVVLNPDAHVGYGAPVGCVMASPTHIYPGPVGVDIKCSMSLLQLDLEEDPDIIMASRDQLRQVFINMFSNAMYAMPEGGDLMITTKQKGHMLHIEIEDTGTGIKQEHLKKVFDSFFTVIALRWRNQS